MWVEHSHCISEIEVDYSARSQECSNLRLYVFLLYDVVVIIIIIIFINRDSEEKLNLRGRK
jgi:hypothetical protein